jgi:hypothetical protein
VRLIIGASLVLAAGLIALGLLGRIGQAQTPTIPAIRFTDITRHSGIDFIHYNGKTSRKLLPETMGSGVAVIDFDKDGKPDLLFINCRAWPGESGDKPTMALYRNLGDGKFEDVTEAAGLAVSLFGMGVTVGDYDNDGWPDLFITGVGGNRLFRNEAASPGKGAAGRRFRDVTAAAKVGGPGGWTEATESDFLARQKPLNWSTSAAFLDYDGDGFLDLFVCNYIVWSPASDDRQGFRLSSGERAYGPPRAFAGAVCFLYRNRGDGTFEDVSKESGVQTNPAGGPLPLLSKGLGVAVADLNGDGWPDIVVANDTERNFLFQNVPGPKGTRRFVEMGQGTGVAYADRHARGAMGIDWGPGYRPGRNALLIGNFADEPDTLLVQTRPSELHFIDRAWAEGIASASKAPLKFGVLFFDYDLDGRLDLFTCNGHLEPDIARAMPDQSFAQAPQLFWNAAPNQGYELVSPKFAGQDLFHPLVGRGCAYSDLHGTGRLDLILTANGGPPRVLRNDGGSGNHWVRFRLEGDGKRSNKSAIGARVILEACGETQIREVAATRGYLSASELSLTFGLGKTEAIDKITIHWPGRNAGPPQVISGLAIDTLHVIRQK